MKIIIPVDEDEEKVCIVFARAPYFMFYDVENGAKECVEGYLKGELVSTGSICHHHEHADECGKH